MDHAALTLAISNPQRSGRRLNRGMRGAVEGQPDLRPIYLGRHHLSALVDLKTLTSDSDSATTARAAAAAAGHELSGTGPASAKTGCSNRGQMVSAAHMVALQSPGKAS